MMRALKQIIFCALLFLNFFPMEARAVLNQPCTSASDCNTAAPICIGVCVTCYDLGDSATCLESATGGSANCQWDGRTCKRLTDLPALPSPRGWIYLLPLAMILTVW